MTTNDYYVFELRASAYLNSAHADKSPRLKYEGEYLVGQWYAKYVVNGNTVVRIPKTSFLDFGRRFLDKLIQNDAIFGDYLFLKCQELASFSEELAQMNYNDIKNDWVRDQSKFYQRYIEIFSLIIGFGYPLDMALEEYAEKNSLELEMINTPRESFITSEERDLYDIAVLSDTELRREALLEHSYLYSYILNNYSGYHPATIEYFENRLKEIGDKTFGAKPKQELEKPRNIYEWIAFLTYIRDERKRCNMIANGMLDRYLKNECEKYQQDYSQAVLLTPEEFEKNKQSKLPDYQGVRYVHATHDGFRDIDEKSWDALIDDEEDKKKIIHGITACKGKVRGKAKIILSTDEFSKMEEGDVIVTSMTRPEFSPIIKKARAIITNEGGITCHAAIISRELNIPCIIATGNATKIIKDGDIVEVDADLGVMRIVSY